MTSEIKLKSNRGGARRGAGRKPGAKERIAKTGAKERAIAVHKAVLARVEPTSEKLDPVEAIMETVEWAADQFRACVAREDWGNARDWANCLTEWSAKAAPYIRPRLAAVAVASEENAVQLIREIKRVIIDPRNA